MFLADFLLYGNIELDIQTQPTTVTLRLMHAAGLIMRYLYLHVADPSFNCIGRV